MFDCPNATFSGNIKHQFHNIVKWKLCFKGTTEIFLFRALYCLGCKKWDLKQDKLIATRRNKYLFQELQSLFSSENYNAITWAPLFDKYLCVYVSWIFSSNTPALCILPASIRPFLTSTGHMVSLAVLLLRGWWWQWGERWWSWSWWWQHWSCHWEWQWCCWWGYCAYTIYLPHYSELILSGDSHPCSPCSW